MNVDHLNSWISALDTAITNQSLNKEKVEAEIKEIEKGVDSLKGEAAPKDLQDLNRRIHYLRDRISPLRTRQMYKSFEGSEDFFKNE